MDKWEAIAYPTPVNNSFLFSFLLMSLRTQKYTPVTSNQHKSEYDYIIVGAGSAGSVVAGRLAESDCVSVLLLEAGHEPPTVTEVPAFADYLSGTDVDWKYKTVPQRNGGSALINNEIPWVAGRMLGGNGNFNGMAYIRGNHKDYDGWEAQGAANWSYKDVFPYFIKMENYMVLGELFNGYHGIGGPINVEKMPYNTLLQQALYDAAYELGYEYVDPNAEKQLGYFDIRMNLRNGQRCSSVKGYLVPSEGKENLDILLNAMATEIIIEGNETKGVEFYHEGQFKTVKVRREVIVSAGALNTPKLLMLSGIGPKDELQKFDIPMKADLPVGENFHDHPALQYYFTLSHKDQTFDEKLANPFYIYEYILTRTGPFVTPGHIFAAFLDGLNVPPEGESPSFSIFAFEVISKLITKRNLKPEVYAQLFGPYENETLYQFSIAALRPKSRGTIKLNSTDPFDPPLIDPNYLAEERDVQDMVNGLKACRKFLNSEALQRLGAKPIELNVPECMDSPSDEEKLRCYARAMVYTYHHGAGSVKMGNPEDPTTVLDYQLKVKNINGLRVVDASVMPQIVSGNPNVPVMMIAEKASDMIKQFWKAARRLTGNF